MKPIGVAVIGASPLNPGWALTAHIPAIQSLPEFELRAVSTSRKASAEAAAQAFGVPAYDRAESAIDHPGVDLVVVAVKAPEHRDLTFAALDAGKMVFTEWPLGIDLAEARKITAQARRAGVRTVVGLQARYAPAVAHARTLVRDGFIGEVLGTTLAGSGIAWAGEVTRSNAYWHDARHGVDVLSVPCMHALEAMNFVLGDFAAVSAAAGVRRSKIRIIEDGSLVPADAIDHVALSATLESGAIASVFYRGGLSRGSNLRWEINGTQGDLVLTSQIGNLQVADLLLEGAQGSQPSVQPLVLPPAYASAPGGLDGSFGANILRQYAALAEDLRTGRSTVPDFEYALQRHELLQATRDAIRTGRTATAPFELAAQR